MFDLLIARAYQVSFPHFSSEAFPTFFTSVQHFFTPQAQDKILECRSGYTQTTFPFPSSLFTDTDDHCIAMFIYLSTHDSLDKLLYFPKRNDYAIQALHAVTPLLIRIFQACRPAAFGRDHVQYCIAEAVRSKSLPIVKRLVQLFGSDYACRDLSSIHGSSLVHLAIYQGDLAILKYLVDLLTPACLYVMDQHGNLPADFLQFHLFDPPMAAKNLILSLFGILDYLCNTHDTFELASLLPNNSNCLFSNITANSDLDTIGSTTRGRMKSSFYTPSNLNTLLAEIHHIRQYREHLWLGNIHNLEIADDVERKNLAVAISSSRRYTDLAKTIQ